MTFSEIERLSSGQGGHDGDQHFALAVEGIDVFFFKIDLNIMLLEGADIGEGIDRASQTGNGLCNDEVDFPGEGILYHLIKTRTVLGVRTADAFVRKHPRKSSRLALDELCVIIDLCLIACKLLIAVGGNTGISCDPSLCYGRIRIRVAGFIVCGMTFTERAVAAITYPSFVLTLSALPLHASPVSGLGA